MTLVSLWPASGPIDPFEHVFSRGRRETLSLNMVESLDGQTRVAGSSSGLNDDDDKELFGALRGASDAVVVGAETARVEGYGGVRLPDRIRQRRREQGLSPVPLLVIVSSSLLLDGIPALTDPSQLTIVMTGRSGHERRHEYETESVEVVRAGDDAVDPVRMVDELGRRGAGVVLCEGGPSLNAQLLTAGLVGELNVTFAPLIVGGRTPSISGGAGGRDCRLLEVLKGDRSLFARYEVL